MALAVRSGQGGYGRLRRSRDVTVRGFRDAMPPSKSREIGQVIGAAHDCRVSWVYPRVRYADRPVRCIFVPWQVPMAMVRGHFREGDGLAGDLTPPMTLTRPYGNASSGYGCASCAPASGSPSSRSAPSFCAPLRRSAESRLERDEPVFATSGISAAFTASLTPLRSWTWPARLGNLAGGRTMTTSAHTCTHTSAWSRRPSPSLRTACTTSSHCCRRLITRVRLFGALGEKQIPGSSATGLRLGCSVRGDSTLRLGLDIAHWLTKPSSDAKWAALPSCGLSLTRS